MSDHVLQSPDETIHRVIDFTDAIPQGQVISDGVVSSDGGTVAVESYTADSVTVSARGLQAGDVTRVDVDATLDNGEAVSKRITIRSGHR